MAWSEEEKIAYGAELSPKIDDDRLRSIVSSWLAAHPGIDPIQMVQWMRDTIGFDPFLLFDEQGGVWLQQELYGSETSDDVLSTALFMGLDSGP